MKSQNKNREEKKRGITASMKRERERRGISNAMHVPDQIKRGSTFEFHAELAKQRQNQSPGYLSLVREEEKNNK